MHLSMLSPRGGAYVGHLTSIAFPTLRNLTRNLGPRVGTFAFFYAKECEDPPLADDDNGNDDEQMSEWVACDSCTESHHIACVEMENISKWAQSANNLYRTQDA